ncbi:MAG: hypothetical protein NUV59_02660 [Patescibacteria group bacterium]|nr:hypothetical protein [Patescibacteria group bacterium]
MLDTSSLGHATLVDMDDMNPVQNPVEAASPMQEPKRWWDHPVVLMLTGVLVIAGAVYLYSHGLFNPLQRAAKAPTPTGKMFLTLYPKDDALVKNPTFTEGYVYDVDSGDLSFVEGGPAYSEQHAFSNNNRLVTFFGGDVAPTDTDDTFNAFMYRAVADPNTLAIVRAEPVSDFAAYAKHVPSISNTGAILFSSLSEASADNSVITRVNDWTIHLIDESNALTDVVNGTYPKWVDENRFVFLKNDGIYYYDLAASEEAPLLRLESGAITSNTKLSVSPTGRYIAWTDFDNEMLYIFEVIDWNADDVLVWEPYTISVAGFWSVFSPDEEFIAVQAVDADAIATAPNPRLEFYRLDTRERYPLEVSLDAFEQEYMFVTDWR